MHSTNRAPSKSRVPRPPKRGILPIYLKSFLPLPPLQTELVRIDISFSNNDS